MKFFRLCIAYLIISLGFQSCETSNKVELTDAEKNWLQEHQTITLAVDDTYPPLNYRDKKNEIVGNYIDLVKIVEVRLGLRIELVGADWNTSLQKAMNHEVDGIINATSLEDRKGKLVFTSPITQDPQALITHKDHKFKNDNYFTNSIIAAKKGSQQLLLLKKKYPDAIIKEVNTILDGMSLLTLYQVDGVYDDLAPLYHFITSNNLSSLHVASVEYNNQQSSIGLRNDDPILLSVFNKAIESITEKEKIAIKEKWIHFSVREDLNNLYISLLVLSFIIILAFLLSYSLKILVNQKTAALNKELGERKKVELKLNKEKTFTNNILESFPGVFCMYKYTTKLKLVRWNKDFEERFNYSKEELLNKEPLDFVDDSEKERYRSAVSELIEKGKVIFESKINTKDGKGIPHFLVMKQFIQNDKEYFLGFGIDVSVKKQLIEELEHKNEQLLKYSFDNAHMVRGSLARILGLLNLIELDNKLHYEEYVPILLQQAQEMDKIVRKISQELYDNSSDN